MSDERSGAIGLSPSLRAMLAPEILTFGQPAATKEDVEAIRAVLADEARSRAGVALGRAMRVAAHAEPSEETAEAIAKVLTDPGVEDGVRRQAAAILGDIAVPAAVRALLAMLARDDAAMEFAVLRALARVGDAQAAEALAGPAKSDSPALARIRSFARTAILFRLGVEVGTPAEHSVMPRGAPLPIKRQTPEAIAKTVAAFRGSAYGVRFHRELGFAFRCGGVSHAVLLDQGLASGGLVRDLRARRRIAGIVAMDDGASGRFIARRIILTRPEREGVTVSIVRPSGQVALLGSLRPVGKRLALSLRDHGGERVPMQIDGTVTDGDIVFSARLFVETAPPKRWPDTIIES